MTLRNAVYGLAGLVMADLALAEPPATVYKRNGIYISMKGEETRKKVPETAPSYSQLPDPDESGLVDLIRRENPSYDKMVDKSILLGSRSPINFTATYAGKARNLTYDPSIPHAVMSEGSAVVAVDRNMMPRRLLREQVIKDVVSAFFRPDMENRDTFYIKFEEPSLMIDADGEKGKMYYFEMPYKCFSGKADALTSGPAKKQ